MTDYLALDLGAESGRAIVATLEADRLTLNEVHRFGNGPVRLPDGLHWDVLRLWSEIKAGIAAAIKSGARPVGIGLDTWGVDFALLDKDGALLGNPFHYRDARTDGMMEKAFKCISRSEIFAQTGIQFMQLNTLYQLYAMALAKSPLFDIAERFVTIPDLFNYWLSGKITNEFTNSTTTQCYNPITRDWSKSMLETLGIPSRLFGAVSAPGTVIGALLPEVAEETGAAAISVVLPACHDTGSAVAAVPALAGNQDFAWISSGTWSIMGAEVLQPALSERALAYNFTNEGGVFGTWRLCKNIMGLWLVQECRRYWRGHGEELSYDEITRMAAEARPFVAVIDPDADLFFHPGDMPEKIRKFCTDSGQSIPQTKGEIIRVALESLALKYRQTLAHVEELSGKRLDPIHIIGGGTKNRLLNQFTADCTGRTVVTGPVEATAIGNVLMQAIGLGHLGSLSEARALVRASFEVEEYQPSPHDDWDAAYSKFLKLLNDKA
ncbi:MAG TPA: rhamnulokinase family protein [Anaerolineales bacterium]|nr:rhamnulokinase family protein [Anaerolineales bacterium]